MPIILMEADRVNACAGEISLSYDLVLLFCGPFLEN